MKIKEMKDDSEIYIYAETAFSHEGDIDYLYSLVDEAVKGEADAIKFQILLDVHDSYTSDVIATSDVFDWVFSEEQWLEIINYATSKGLEVVLLPIDMKALDFCLNHQDIFEMLEVHSINFNHYFMLEKIKQIEDKIIILGIGGHTLSDIEYALNVLKRSYLDKRILLIYGFQLFPTKPENLKMSMIDKMNKVFELPVGYADHTAYNQDDSFLLQVAYINGARIFEKHLVLNRGEERTDFQAAVDGVHLKNLRKELKRISMIQGSSTSFSLNIAEQKYRNREKKIVAVEEINAGDIMSEKNIGYKVTKENSLYEQKDINKILQTRATERYLIDDVIK